MTPETATPADGAPHRGGLVWLVSASVLLGVMAVFVRLAAIQMPATQVAFFRFLGSLLVLLAVTRGRGLRPRPGNGGRLVLRGVLGAAAIALYFIAIRGAGAGLAALLQSSYTVFAALIASALLGERFTARLAVALGLNLAGAAAVLGSELRVDPGAEVGMLAALGAAVLGGGAVVAARHLRHSENASLITTHFMAVGAAVTAPSLLAGVPPPDGQLAAALAVVVLSSVAGQWLLHHGLGFASAARASLVAATGVVTASLLEAIVFGGETFSPGTIAGGALMIAAVGLAYAAPGSQVSRVSMSSGA